MCFIVCPNFFKALLTFVSKPLTFLFLGPSSSPCKSKTRLINIIPEAALKRPPLLQALFYISSLPSQSYIFFLLHPNRSYFHKLKLSICIILGKVVYGSDLLFTRGRAVGRGTAAALSMEQLSMLSCPKVQCSVTVLLSPLLSAVSWCCSLAFYHYEYFLLMLIYTFFSFLQFFT